MEGGVRSFRIISQPHFGTKQAVGYIMRVRRCMFMEHWCFYPTARMPMRLQSCKGLLNAVNQLHWRGKGGRTVDMTKCVSQGERCAVCTNENRIGLESASRYNL